MDAKHEKIAGNNQDFFCLYPKLSSYTMQKLSDVNRKINLACSRLFFHLEYGNKGCGDFKRGVQNSKDFCLRINILKGNY